MAGNELVFSKGVWHPTVLSELKKLVPKSPYSEHKLSDEALFELKNLPYSDAITVLHNMQILNIKDGRSAWVVRECEKIRDLVAPVEENFYHEAAKLLNNCHEKAYNVLVSKSKIPKPSNGAASKDSAPKGAASKDSAPKGAARKGIPPPSGGAARD
jgi:hypothetical protein